MSTCPNFIARIGENQEVMTEPCACFRHPDGSVFYCECHAPLLDARAKEINDLWQALAVTSVLMCAGFAVLLIGYWYEKESDSMATPLHVRV